MKQIKKYVPLVVKISPDLSAQEILLLLPTFYKEVKLDGVIATNTTITREGIENSPYAAEIGGLSGKPLQQKSTFVIRELKIFYKIISLLLG